MCALRQRPQKRAFHARYYYPGEFQVSNCLVCWTCHGRMGPNHFTLSDGGAVCGLCQAKNPLGNLRKMAIQEVTMPVEIIVCFGPGGPAGQPGTVVVNALHIDCKTVLGPRITLASADTLEKALIYLGATDAQMEDHRQSSSPEPGLPVDFSV